MEYNRTQSLLGVKAGRGYNSVSVQREANKYKKHRINLKIPRNQAKFITEELHKTHTNRHSHSKTANKMQVNI